MHVGIYSLTEEHRFPKPGGMGSNPIRFMEKGMRTKENEDIISCPLVRIILKEKI